MSARRVYGDCFRLLAREPAALATAMANDGILPEDSPGWWISDGYQNYFQSPVGAHRGDSSIFNRRLFTCSGAMRTAQRPARARSGPCRRSGRYAG